MRFIDIPEGKLYNSELNTTNATTLITILTEIDRLNHNDVFFIKANVYDATNASNLEKSVKKLLPSLHTVKVVAQKDVANFITNGTSQQFLQQSKKVILLTAALEDFEQLSYFKSPESFGDDINYEPDSKILGDSKLLNLSGFYDDRGTCRYFNYTLEGGIGFVYGLNQDIDFVKLHEAYACGISVIFSDRQLQSDFLKQGFLFFILQTALNEVSEGCFYLTLYKEAVDKYSKNTKFYERCLTKEY